MKKNNSPVKAFACSFLLLAGPAISQTPALQLLFSPTNAREGEQVLLSVADARGIAQAELWSNQERRCTAFKEQNTLHCKFALPHGGDVAMQFRYRRDGQNNWQQLPVRYRHQAIEIASVQPQTLVSGRSAVIFARLSGMSEFSLTRPTGIVSFHLADGTALCTVALPNPSFCQVPFNVPGRTFVYARYSGDNNYPALQSEAALVTVIEEGRMQQIFSRPANAIALARFEGSNFNENGHLKDRVSADGQSALTTRGLADYINLSNIPLDLRIGQNFATWADESRLMLNRFSNTATLVDARGSTELRFVSSAIPTPIIESFFFVDVSDQALDSRDNNAKPDIYIRHMYDFSQPAQWISHRADGSAAPNGVRLIEKRKNVVVFAAEDPGFTPDDVYNLENLFLWQQGQLLVRAPFNGHEYIDISANGRYVLGLSARALLPGSVAGTSQLYRFDTMTQGLLQYTTDEQFSRAKALDNGDIVISKFGTVSFGVTTPASVTLAKADGSRVPIPNATSISKLTDNGTLVANGGTLVVNLQTLQQSARPTRVQGDDEGYLSQLVDADANLRTLGFYADHGQRNARVLFNGNELSIPALRAQMSRDGSTVYFTTAQSLVVEDINGFNDVYAMDLATQSYTLLSRAPDGTRPIRASLLAHSERFLLMRVTLAISEPSLVVRVNKVTQAVDLLSNIPSNCTERLLNRERRWVAYLCRQSSAIVESFRLDLENGSFEALAFSGLELTLDFSDDGRFQLFSRSDLSWSAHLRDLQSNQVTEIFRETDSNRISRGMLSSDGRFAIISSNRTQGATSDPLPVVSEISALKHFVYDRKRAEGLLLDGSPALGSAISRDGCSLILGDRQSLKRMQNPLCKTASYLSIFRTIPQVPNWHSPTRVQVIVGHKSDGIAPSGSVRISGLGGSCTAVLAAQGLFGFGECSLQASAPLRASEFYLSELSNIKAEYLGDQTYGSSVAVERRALSKSALSITAQLNQPAANHALIQISAQVQGASSTQPFQGFVEFSSSDSLTACRLSAAEISALNKCSLWLSSSASATTQVFAKVMDPHYQGSSGFQFDVVAEEIKRTGFEF